MRPELVEGQELHASTGSAGIEEGDEVEVVEDGSALRIVRVTDGASRGQRLVRRMRGRANTTMSTDELQELLRGD
jgi:hypothetical protein